jgi:hypothetical protein
MVSVCVEAVTRQEHWLEADQGRIEAQFTSIKTSAQRTISREETDQEKDARTRHHTTCLGSFPPLLTPMGVWIRWRVQRLRSWR